MSDRTNGWPGSDGFDQGEQVPRGIRHVTHVIRGEAWEATGPPDGAPAPRTADTARRSGTGRVNGITPQHDGNRVRSGATVVHGRGARTADPGGPGGPGGPPRTLRPRRTPRPPRSRARRLLRAAVLLVCLVLVTSVGTYVWAALRLKNDIDLGGIPDRVPPGRGTNYLVVGSDSRAGLSGRDRKKLHTGGSPGDGRRTDSMILLHTGAHGTTMMSLPRDSWVTIPSYVRPDTGSRLPAAKDKLNAAFSYGGPELLIRTIERNTGLRIDHYAEMGLAGFVDIVNAVGGVEMCVDRDIRDEKTGLDLTKGCHRLDGRTALAFVRERHQEKEGDLGRGRNQQKFLAALAQEAATPGVALSPPRIYSTMRAGLDSLVVDTGTDLRTLASLLAALRSVTAGHGRRVEVPVASLGVRTPRGSAVTWDAPRARKLFTDLRDDRSVRPGATVPRSHASDGALRPEG